MSFYTCGPNECLVVSGCCYGKPAFVPGGRIFVLPTVQQIQRLPLGIMTVEVYSPKVYTKLGVAISVTGIAQVKIQGQNKEMLAAAAQQFLGKSVSDIRHIALETLEGHQRAIMGLMTVEEIYQDRHKFSEQVFQVATADLVNMGITVVSYTLKDIHDEEGYLQSLGMGRTAEVKRDARMGEADANKEARIREAMAEEKRKEAQFSNEIMIAKSKRDFEIQKAAYDMEVNANKAKADLAYKLQAAKVQQNIREEEMSVQVVERAQAIEIQKQEVTRRERELDATVRRPAEAEKYRLEKAAEAERQRVIIAAEAEAQAEQMRGEAEAFSIEAKAKADAEQMVKKAAAWREYKDAAMAEMVLQTLPKVAAEIAAPLTANVEQIRMISTDTNAPVGAAKLTGEMIDVMVRLPDAVEKMTGVSIKKATKL